jgi:acyl-CoA synthetase (AMP-forming)/AMP-acid ligase II
LAAAGGKKGGSLIEFQSAKSASFDNASFDNIENIVDIIRLHAVTTPERVAIVEGDRAITYAELHALILQYGGYLAQLGLRPKDRLGLILRDHADHLVLMLAAASIGVTTLSPSWRSKIEEKRLVAEAFGTKLLIVDPGARAPPGSAAVPLDDTWRQGAANAAPHQPARSARALPFRILMTSGTTGVPKGVEMTHARAVAWCQLVSAALNLTSPQRHLSVLPLAFTGSFILNLPHLLLGNTVELFPPLFTPEEFVAAVKTRGITSSTIVPTLLRRLLAMPRDHSPLLPELDYLVCLGSSLSADERRDAVRLLTRNFFDNYGASGCGPITFLSAADIESHADSVGRAVAQTQVQVVDGQGRPRAAGEIGLLRCRGPAVAEGFCNATSDGGGELFDNGWYHPGELASIDQDGFIYLAGRASDLILRGAINVYPVEIEQVLMRHPGVREAAVVGAPSLEYDEDVVAFVQVVPGVLERDLMETCRRYLSSYKVPSLIVVLDELPKNPAGKILKPELLQRLAQRQYPKARN